MIKISKYGAAALVAGVLALAAGCGSDGGSTGAAGGTCRFGPTDNAEWTAKLDAGLAEGHVNWYHIFAPDQGARVVEAFNEVCPGIEVVPTATGKALLPQVEQQLANGSDGADVFVWGDEEWFKAHADDMAELSGPFGQDYPAEAFFVPNKVAQVFTLPIGVIAWNTSEFPDGFDDFPDLLDPALDGRIGTREDITTSYIGYLQFLETTYGADYLTDLAALDPKFYPSAYVIADSLASGEIGVANTTAIAAVNALKERGAPIDYTIPAKSFAVPSTLGVLADSKRLAAADVFAEYLLSPEGQTALVGDGDGGSQLDVPGAADLSGSEVLAASTVTADTRAEWTTKFDEIFRNG